MKVEGDAKEHQPGCGSSTGSENAVEGRKEAQGVDLTEVQRSELKKAYRLALCGSLENPEELGIIVEALGHVIHQ